MTTNQLAASATPVSSGIRISEVRIRDFRSLRNVDISLSDLTILVGANNAGKTSFLEALYLSLGAGRRSLSRDDIFLSPGEASVPRSRRAVIDVQIRPTDTTGTPLTAFPAGGFWLDLWATALPRTRKTTTLSGFERSSSGMQHETTMALAENF